MHEISRRYQTSESDSDGGSSSSSGRDAIVERTLAVRDDGIEFEYDLPADVGAADRARQWQFPARVLKAADGSWRLLNETELTARRDAWLTRAKLPRSACGRWYFTWNAFRIDCDPQAVLKQIAASNPWANALETGAPYDDPVAMAPATLTRGGTPTTLVATLTIDPAAVRRERAQADVVAAEILGRKNITLDTAITARADEDISGTITVTIDESGGVGRLVKLTETAVRRPDGKTETRRATEHWERRKIRAGQP